MEKKGKKRVTEPILKPTDEQKPETFFFGLKALGSFFSYVVFRVALWALTKG